MNGTQDKGNKVTSLTNKHNILILWLFIFILVILEIYSIYAKSEFKFDSLIMMAILLIVYLYEDKIKLTNLGFSLLGILFILHNLGAFGFYNLSFIGIGYDKYIHFFAGIVLAVMSSDMLKNKYPKLRIIGISLVTIIALGVIHEAFENLGTAFFGQGEGAFFFGPGDIGRHDSLKDIGASILGAIITLIFKKH